MAPADTAPQTVPEVPGSGGPLLEIGAQRRHRRLRCGVRAVGDVLLRGLGLRVVPRARERSRRVMIDALAALADFWMRQDRPLPGWQATGIVLSKDRPLQLHALLGSYLHHCNPAPPLDVLYVATSPAFEQAYGEVAALFGGAGVHLHREQAFAGDVQRLLRARASQGVFFLVDDIIFLRPVDFAALGAWPLGQYVPSLRLGPQVNRSWFFDRAMQVPALRPVDAGGGLLSWSYADGDGTLDWTFPISLDGDVFMRAELLEMLRHVGFKAPNSLEHALTVYLPMLRQRQGLCFDRPRLVNLPLNRVQREVANRAAELSPELLLEHWRAGLMLDVDALYDAPTDSVHAPLAVSFRTRPPA